MILVGQYDSPFVRRVAVTLHQYGIAFERDPKSIFGDAEALRAMNPLGRVPVLVLDDGETLSESAAILDYLDELAGTDQALTPAAGRERRDVLQAAALAAGISEKVAALFFERLHHAPEARSEAWERECRMKIAGGLAELERRCQAPWFYGERMTQADISIACMLMHLFLRFPELFSLIDHPRLSALRARCEKEQAFIDARPGEDETVPAAKA